MIRAEKLKIFYSKLIFDNVSFVLGNNEKVGLVGLNGCGKTTLLKIMAGIEQPDSGRFEVQNEKISYLPQEYSFDENLLIGEFLESLVEDHRTEMYKITRILNKLNFEVDMFQEIKVLSEGQKMKLYLTKLLSENPTILLLDEPTNHLDIEGIAWLENFINSFEGICIIISHDRAFLDNCVTKIFEIDENTLHIYEGNYTEFLEHKKNYIQKRRDEFVLQERKREKLETLLSNAAKIKDGKRRSKAISAAKHRIDREILRNEQASYVDQTLSNLNLKGFVHNSKTVLKINNLSFHYEQDKPLLKSSNFEMYGKERVWFYGRNGIGKTTLVKLILGELNQINGEVKIGESLRFTYFSQNQSHLNMDETVESFFLRNTNVTYNSSFGVMEKFLFTKDIRNTKIARLSPGQRARLSFAVFSMNEYDFMILDEPTNHLDIRSKEVIEDALRDFKGAIFLISHDRYFVNSIGIDKKLTIKDHKLVSN